MAYSGKTNWQNNEIVEAADMNRIEQGLVDHETALGNLDTALKTNEDAIDDLAGEGRTIETVKGNTDAITAHLAESATDAHLAKNIGIEDTAGNFSALNVEGALAEVFTSVSSGKGLIATAITDKGVPTGGSDTFQTMATNIANIQTDSPHGEQIYSTPGTYTFTVPEGVTQISYLVTGAGGGGQGFAYSQGGHGGGGGGTLIAFNVEVSPGQTLNVTVGAGGAGGAYGGNAGGKGGDTAFGVAIGGGGYGGSTSGPGAGGINNPNDGYGSPGGFGEWATGSAPGRGGTGIYGATGGMGGSGADTTGSNGGNGNVIVVW